MTIYAELPQIFFFVIHHQCFTGYKYFGKTTKRPHDVQSEGVQAKMWMKIMVKLGVDGNVYERSYFYLLMDQASINDFEHQSTFRF